MKDTANKYMVQVNVGYGTKMYFGPELKKILKKARVTTTTDKGYYAVFTVKNEGIVRIGLNGR